MDFPFFLANYHRKLRSLGEEQSIAYSFWVLIQLVLKEGEKKGTQETLPIISSSEAVWSVQDTWAMGWQTLIDGLVLLGRRLLEKCSLFQRAWTHVSRDYRINYTFREYHRGHWNNHRHHPSVILYGILLIPKIYASGNPAHWLGNRDFYPALWL